MNAERSSKREAGAASDKASVRTGASGTQIRLVITGGGTGGHVFPGIAVAEALAARCNLCCLWIGTGRPVEKRALGKREWNYEILKVRPLKGKGPVNILSSLAYLPISVIRAAVLLKRFGPDAVLGVGGYVSGPVLAASRLLGIPSAIHEQNLLPGLANKLASRLVDKVFISFEASRSYFRNSSIVCAGNPVRRQILKEAASPPEKGANTRTHILILGGSQGASGLNRLASSALRILDQSGLRFSAIHQTGPRDRREIETFYRDAGTDVLVHEFINQMGIAYSWADLIICRAGATTLAEVTAIGKPVICIPYPYSADGHQGLNARAVSDAGAGLYFEEGDVGAVRLASEIEKLMSNRKKLAEMTRRARQLGRPEAAVEIAESILMLCKNGKGKKCSMKRNRGETVHGHV